jgi:hypothetical protein
LQSPCSSCGCAVYFKQASPDKSFVEEWESDAIVGYIVVANSLFGFIARLSLLEERLGSSNNRAYVDSRRHHNGNLFGNLSLVALDTRRANSQIVGRARRGRVS